MKAMPLPYRFTYVKPEPFNLDKAVAKAEENLAMFINYEFGKLSTDLLIESFHKEAPKPPEHGFFWDIYPEDFIL